MTVLLPWLLSREISNIKVMLPLIADKLPGGISLLTGASEATARTASGFTVNSEQVKRTLMSNPILVTGLNVIVGYEAAAAVLPSPAISKGVLCWGCGGRGDGTAQRRAGDIAGPVSVDKSHPQRSIIIASIS